MLMMMMTKEKKKEAGRGKKIEEEEETELQQPFFGSLIANDLISMCIHVAAVVVVVASREQKFILPNQYYFSPCQIAPSMPPHLIRILWSNFYLNINANFMEMLRNLIENWPFQQI